MIWRWTSKRWANILLHLAVWTLFFMLPILLRPAMDHFHRLNSGKPHTGYGPWDITGDMVTVFLFYLNAFLFIPRLLYRYNIWKFVILHVLILTLLILTISPVLIFPYVMIMAMSTAYKLILDRLQADRLFKEKENENLKTELTLLRSQVSPHFMFNVLNNMVALARKHSEQLEPSLIKLSSLMRYMLYEADEDKVPLERELEYLQSYIDLQQQRFGKNVQVKVDMDAGTGQLQIEPMLLIPFVENAFKHGTGMIEDPQIEIRLEVKAGKLFFTVRNRYSVDTQEIKDKTSGIGLANVRRRLNLLYGKNHHLEIKEQNHWFEITLELDFH